MLMLNACSGYDEHVIKQLYSYVLILELLSLYYLNSRNRRSSLQILMWCFNSLSW